MLVVSLENGYVTIIIILANTVSRVPTRRPLGRAIKLKSELLEGTYVILQYLAKDVKHSRDIDKTD